MKKIFNNGNMFFSKFKKNYNFVTLHITDYCNSNCFYCTAEAKPYKNLDNIKFNDTTFEYFCKFLDTLDGDGIVLELFGGEPTLVPNLKKYIDILYKKYNIHIYLFTNFIKPIEYYLKFPKQLVLKGTWHYNINQTEEYLKALGCFTTKEFIDNYPVL